MKFKFALSLCALLSGCMTVTNSMYLPRDKSKIYEGTYCGNAPEGGWRQPLTDKSLLSISATPKVGTVAMSIQIILDPKIEFQFLDTAATISVDTGQQVSAAILLYGRPRFQPIPTTTKIYGLDPKLPFFASLQIPIAAPKTILVQLPSVAIDGRTIGIPATEIELVKRSGVMTCIQ